MIAVVAVPQVRALRSIRPAIDLATEDRCYGPKVGTPDFTRIRISNVRRSYAKARSHFAIRFHGNLLAALEKLLPVEYAPIKKPMPTVALHWARAIR